MAALRLVEQYVSQPDISGAGVRYRMGPKIASGGMATVHVGLSETGTARRVVALKQMHPHMADDEGMRECFLDEASLALRLTHPNVCVVHGQGANEGVPFIAMELLFGRPLDRFMKDVWRREDVLDSERRNRVVARLLADVCEGLHAAHELRDARGELLEVVHRDVSPHNVFVTESGHASVIDFGIAKVRDNSHRTATGIVKGKFAYMAPEQLRGKSVDRRADIWSLGVMLWEMITGRRLFLRSNESQTILAVLEARIPPVDADPPIALLAIAQRALEADPEDRYASAREMGESLAHFAASGSRPALVTEVAECVSALYGDELAQMHELVRDFVRSVDAEEEPDVLVEIGPEDVGETSGVVHKRSLPPPQRRSGLAMFAGLLGGTAAIVILGLSLFPSAPATSTPADTPPAPVVPDAPEIAIIEEPAPAPIEEIVVADAPGSLVLSTNGPALVFENGERIARAPGPLTLEPGTHELSLVRAGRVLETLTVDIVSGEEQRVAVRLPRAAPRVEEAPGASNVFRELDY